MANPVLLIGDIGGTNARFALVDDSGPSYRDELVLQCADYESPELAIGHYLETNGVDRPDAICLAAAGPVVDGSINLTNNHWQLSKKALRDRFASEMICLLNDFEAIAYSLPALDANAAQSIGIDQRPDLDARTYTVAVIGPGTGFGAAALLKRDATLVPLVTEAGHLGFSPETDRQQAVRNHLQSRFGRVAYEQLLSGSGLINIYQALSAIESLPAELLTTEAIFSHVDDDPLAKESVALFFAILGQAAGDFVLSTGSFDGLFIAGGIVPRHPELLANSSFRGSFEAKGQHKYLMQRVPTLLIHHPQPGLLGASEVIRLLVSN